MTEVPPYYALTKEEAYKCYSFRENENTLTLTYFKGGEDCGTDIVIPSEVAGKPVTEIYSYTFNNKGITSVYIPDTVVTIGSRAFAYNKLTNVDIPTSVKTISSEAFLSNKISSLNMQEGVTTIGQAGFRHNQLTEAIVPNSVTSLGACAYCDNPIPNPSFLYVKNGDTYNYSAVRGYIGNLTEFEGKRFVIPAVMEGQELETITSNAFSSMSLSGWEVVIPSTVKKIESSAFSYSGVGKVNLPEGLTSIGGSAFYANSLTELVLPSTLTYIGPLAFNRNYVTNLDQAWIYERTTTGINYGTIIGYAGANRTNVVIPATKDSKPLTKLGDSALLYLNLKGTLVIPNTVKSYGSTVFNLNELTQVDNGDGILEGPFVYGRNADGTINREVLHAYAGYGGNVTVPSQVKKLSSYSFYYSHVTGVTLPEGLTSIGAYSFYICHLNGTVVIPSTVTEIGYWAFHKNISWDGHNSGLVKIVNKTGKSFNWKDITAGHEPANFVTGTAVNWYGDVEITATE